MSLKLGFARVPSKLPKSSLTKFYRLNIHPFISLRKEELLDILWLDKKSLISCVVYKYQSKSPFVDRENPL